MAERLAVRRDYWSGDHRTYQGLIKDHDGDSLDRRDVISALFDEAGIEDGDEFVISVERTGERPWGDRRVILQEPHTYGLETDAQLAARTSVNVQEKS